MKKKFDSFDFVIRQIKERFLFLSLSFKVSIGSNLNNESQYQYQLNSTQSSNVSFSIQTESLCYNENYKFDQVMYPLRNIRNRNFEIQRIV